MTFDYRARRARLAELLPAREVHALLVTSPVNVRYLTGLASSNAAVLVRADGTAMLATDNRYIEAARGLEVPAVEVADVAGRLAAPGVGIEAANMSVAAFRRLGRASCRWTRWWSCCAWSRTTASWTSSVPPARSPTRRSPTSAARSPPG
ncbi:aminopeptidase P family N-terminal domain-containing protein [Nonomuraea antimicrobica]